MSSFFSRLLGGNAKPESAAAQRPATPAASQVATRRELLRQVLRETLARSGIPAEWVTADALVGTARGAETGIHVRLVMRHWDPRLVLHSLAFQDDVQRRLLVLDPLAAAWLTGFSWQYALPAGAEYPPLPAPESWKEAPASAAAPDAALPAPAPAAAPSPSEARAELEKMFAAGDAAAARAAGDDDAGFPTTEPAGLR